MTNIDHVRSLFSKMDREDIYFYHLKGQEPGSSVPFTLFKFDFTPMDPLLFLELWKSRPPSDQVIGVSQILNSDLLITLIGHDDSGSKCAIAFEFSFKGKTRPILYLSM